MCHCGCRYERGPEGDCGLTRERLLAAPEGAMCMMEPSDEEGDAEMKKVQNIPGGGKDSNEELAMLRDVASDWRREKARAEAAEAKLAEQAADAELGRLVRMLPNGLALWSLADAWRVIDVEAVCTRGFSLTPLDALKSAGVGCIEALRARGKEEG